MCKATCKNSIIFFFSTTQQCQTVWSRAWSSRGRPGSGVTKLTFFLPYYKLFFFFFFPFLLIKWVMVFTCCCKQCIKKLVYQSILNNDWRYLLPKSYGFPLERSVWTCGCSYVCIQCTFLQEAEKNWLSRVYTTTLNSIHSINMTRMPFMEA